MIALDDCVNMVSPYQTGFNLTLKSEDFNYDEQEISNYNITIEDNDEGKGEDNNAFVGGGGGGGDVLELRL